MACVAQGVIAYFYLAWCGDLLSLSSDYPTVSVGFTPRDIKVSGCQLKECLLLEWYPKGIFTLSLLSSIIILYYSVYWASRRRIWFRNRSVLNFRVLHFGSSVDKFVAPCKAQLLWTYCYLYSSLKKVL